MKCSLTLIWAILFTGCLAAPVAAEDTLTAKIKEVIDHDDYKQAHWGMLIVEAKSGRTLFERDPERLFIPASTTKLFSCATALATFGPDYRFNTPVYQNGEVKDGILLGDLILVASGDLTFGGRIGKDGKTVFTNYDHTYANSGLLEASLTDTDPVYALDQLAKQIAKAGIKEVKGEILIDDRLFKRAQGTGSGPDLLSPMIVNDNVLDIMVQPGKKPGEPANVRTRPATAYFQIDADVVTAAPGKPTTLTLNATSPTNLSIRGELAHDAKPLVRVYAVDEPILYARALFIEALRRHGIRCNGSLFRPESAQLPDPDRYAKMPKPASFQSAPLSEAITVTLKVSHNLYASTLPLLVATKHGERTLEEGMKFQGAFLKKLGVPVQTISFAGGAGGAQSDSITPRATVTLLQKMAERPEAEVYFNALPIIGVDGTLVNVLPPDSPVKGKVRAKTGTLVYHDLMNERVLLRSKALAGTMETAKGTKLYFAMFVNEVPLPRGAAASREGKILGKLCEIIHQHGQ
ncbi:MAG: D-alanyl-D-alanine carboxypeptidase/D-alanyl-D-alanine-endopeptidase [Planctomycetes bacterium]|nr:D-alanyl-D-alanine carboxypeptidase/D-alanyl-D-alanine-endopeptidase [Planctomycetota bacterium]